MHAWATSIQSKLALASRYDIYADFEGPVGTLKTLKTAVTALAGRFELLFLRIVLRYSWALLLEHLYSEQYRTTATIKIGSEGGNLAEGHMSHAFRISAYQWS